MDRHPDITDILTHDCIVDLFAASSSTRVHRATTTPAWRRFAGAALVRLGEAILGEPRSTNRAVALNAPSPAR